MTLIYNLENKKFIAYSSVSKINSFVKMPYIFNSDGFLEIVVISDNNHIEEKSIFTIESDKVTFSNYWVVPFTFGLYSFRAIHFVTKGQVLKVTDADYPEMIVSFIPHDAASEEFIA